MYLKLLDEAVALQKGEKPAPVDTECLVDLQIQAHIPEDYIPNLHQRLDIYRRIADIRSQEDADDVVDELIDRFGEPPVSVLGLIDIAELRNLAAARGIYEMKQADGRVLLYQKKIDKQEIARLIAKMNGRVLVSAGSKPYISIRLQGGDVLQELKDVLLLMAPPVLAPEGKASGQTAQKRV